MKSTLIFLVVCITIAASVSGALAGACPLGSACNGPVRQLWSFSSDCGGNPTSTVSINSGMVKGGECFAYTPASGVSGSSKVSCGIMYTQKIYYTPDCSGPYTMATIQTDSCIKATSNSMKVQCAGANSVSYSIAFLCLAALMSLLLM